MRGGVHGLREALGDDLAHARDGHDLVSRTGLQDNGGPHGGSSLRGGGNATGYGGAGNATEDGGAGNATGYGGAGNATEDGGAGNATEDGGAGECHRVRWRP